MISVATALEAVFDLVAPLPSETVALRLAAGRVLAKPVEARRTQPPFRTAIMDGYALRGAEVRPRAAFKVIGEAAAGHAWKGHFGPGEAVRIFTGAVVPDGADRVVIQEDAERHGDQIVLRDDIDPQAYVRSVGADFLAGARIEAPRRLTPQDVSLIAAMNVPEVAVTRKPVVALIATGDELVMPGEEPADDQIVASNAFGLAAMIEAEGGEARILPIARDTVASLASAFSLAAGADLIVSIGGASAGDHDLVALAAEELGLDRAFYKVAMRPGKPLMAGTMAGIPMIGLPGNPVSSMVCGHVFIRPALRVMLGMTAEPLPRDRLPLAAPLGANGAREHYMRARIEGRTVRVADRQDSALLSVLAAADALVVRPPHAAACGAGEDVDVIRL